MESDKECRFGVPGGQTFFGTTVDDGSRGINMVKAAGRLWTTPP